MELVNDFTVNVPIDEAWKTLTDVERIAPCLPGAQLQEVEGDVYRGVVKVKVGPILAQFKGQATFVEKDETNHKAVLKAEGRDTTGKGNASALITARLEPEGDTLTKVTVATDLTITGKVAQFGRGALADVSTKLLGQFVDQLESTVLNQPQNTNGSERPAAPTAAAPTAAPAAATDVEPATAADAPAAATATATETPAPDASAAVRKVDHAESAPIDLIDTAGAPLAKRIVPVAVLVVIAVVVIRRIRHK
jgi:carbon monoxide dehydrogenase subunit G